VGYSYSLKPLITTSSIFLFKIFYAFAISIKNSAPDYHRRVKMTNKDKDSMGPVDLDTAVGKLVAFVNNQDFTPVTFVAHLVGEGITGVRGLPYKCAVAEWAQKVTGVDKVFVCLRFIEFDQDYRTVRINTWPFMTPVIQAFDIGVLPELVNKDMF
jgi:hypothetical protein